MKKSTKIISAALAAMMAASTAAVGSVAVSAAKVKKPAKVKAVNVSKGIKITWKKVKGAKKYQVFRGKKKITTTKKKAYTDKKAKAGKSYKYYVKAVKGKKVSKKSKAAKVVRLKAPVISSATNAASGVKVSWKKSAGAKKYNVYRDSKKIGEAKGTSYTDANAVSDTKYTYKVKAVNGKSASVFSKTTSVTFLAAPVVTIDKDFNLKWDAVSGADYQVYRQRACEDSAKKIADVKETEYKDEALGDNPTAYKYFVYAVKGSVKSGAQEVAQAYIPDGSYDPLGKDVPLNIYLKLNKGDTYKEGSIFTDYFDLKKSVDKTTYYSISSDYDTNVVTVKDGVITAVGEGTTKITVELKTAEAQEYVYNAICAAAGKEFGNHLKDKIYVNVTVK